MDSKEKKLLEDYKPITYRIFSTLSIIRKCKGGYDYRTSGIAIYPQEEAKTILKNILGENSEYVTNINMFYHYLSLAEEYVKIVPFYKATYAVITDKGEEALANKIIQETKGFMLNDLKSFIETLPELRKKDEDVFLTIICTLREIADKSMSEIVVPQGVHSLKTPEQINELIEKTSQVLRPLTDYNEKNAPRAFVQYTYINSKGHGGYKEEYMLLPELSRELKEGIKGYEDELKKFEYEEGILEYYILDKIKNISEYYHRPASIYELSQHIKEKLGEVWDIDKVKNVLKKFCNPPYAYLYEEGNMYYIEPKNTNEFEEYCKKLPKPSS